MDLRDGTDTLVMTAGVAPDTRMTHAEVVSRARALVTGIQARASQTEMERRVPDTTISELFESGLFGLITPRRWGGAELGLDALLDVTAELAAACGSTGWVYAVLVGHFWLTCQFSEQAQADVFDNPRSLVAGLLRLGGPAPERASGGYVWRGARGRFCSGVDHSNWVIGGGTVDGEHLVFLMPLSDFEIVDDWQTAGLRGTGSKSIVLGETFIPEHRAVRMQDLAAGRSPGGALYQNVLYRVPLSVGWLPGVVGPALGIARGLLNTFTNQTRAKLQEANPLQLAEQGALYGAIARASAEIDAAFSIMRADLAATAALPSPDALSALDMERLRRNRAFAIDLCRTAAERLFEASGGSGLYEATGLPRMWRDAHAASAHASLRWSEAAPRYGRAVLGLPPSNPAQAPAGR